MYSKKFWSEAIERAIKTAAQSVILAWGAANGADLFELDWQEAVGFGLGGFVLSLLTSVASGAVAAGGKGSPSLVDE